MDTKNYSPGTVVRATRAGSKYPRSWVIDQHYHSEQLAGKTFHIVDAHEHDYTGKKPRRMMLHTVTKAEPLYCGRN